MFKKLMASHRVRRRVSWMIAAILILPFIFFFHATGQAPIRGPGGIAGTLFGRPVPWDAFQEERGWMARQLKNRLGDMADSFSSMITTFTWDRLLLAAEARHRHLRIDDKTLAEFIEKIPAFQEQGRFVRDRYYRYVRALGMTPQMFERLIRNDLVIDQLINSVKNTVTITDAEVRAAYDKKHERLRATVIAYDPATFRTQAEEAVTEADLKAYYDDHPEEVRVPAQVSVEYAGASRFDLSPGVQLSGADLEAFYQDHQDRFKKDGGTTTPLEEVKEEVRRQVVEERVNKQLTALALDLQDDVDEKKPFDEVIRTRALTARRAGPAPTGALRIPEGSASSLLPNLQDVAEGQLSGVLHTDNGVYIARITQRIPSRLPPLEEVRAKIHTVAIRQRARELARAKADALHTRLKEQLAAGVRFEEASLSYGDAPVQPATFTRTDPVGALGAVPQVNAAAFATSLGNLTDLLETSKGFVIVRPEELLPADASKSADEEAALRKDVLTEQQNARFEQWMQELRTRAKLRSFVDTPVPTP